MKKLLYILIQWTWGIPQNLAGLFVYCGCALARRETCRLERPRSAHAYRERYALLQKHEYQGRPYKLASVTYWNHWDSLSLGMFLFIGKRRGLRTIKHEYGHSIQSMILGPFYLIAVGIPSVLWCHWPALAEKWKKGEVSYYSRYPENWADKLGGVTDKDTDECIRNR